MENCFSQAQGSFRYPRRGRSGHAKPIALDAKQGETGVGFPIFLADGKHFLVRVANGEARSAIHLASLDSPDRKMILDNVFSAALVAPTPRGKTYLMYMRDTALVAHELDERAGAVRGNPRVIVDGIGRVASPAVHARSRRFSQRSHCLPDRWRVTGKLA